MVAINPYFLNTLYNKKCKGRDKNGERILYNHMEIRRRLKKLWYLFTN